MARRDVRELLERPVVVAPMAGGPSTPELVVAAAGAGALAFLAAGYKTVADMASEIGAVRAATSRPFGVNVFVPGSPARDPSAVAAYLASLAGDIEAVGGALGDASWDDDHWEEKISTLLADPPPVVSFTFGCPDPDLVAAFQAQGTVVAVTVTGPDEATVAGDAGADCVCSQGFEAGGHRGSFADDGCAGEALGLLSLIQEVARVTDLPQIAAGGIMGPRAVAAVLAGGAVAAQCGTAFLRCPESGANPAHKDALVDPRFAATAVTRAFSGRRARGLVNAFLLAHRDAPAAYPEINRATRPLRAAATSAGDTDRMSLWAGQGHRAATDRPAAELVGMLSP